MQNQDLFDLPGTPRSYCGYAFFLKTFIVLLVSFTLSNSLFAQLASPLPSSPTPKGAYSLVISNGYGDVYRMNLMRDRYNYQAYRGICSYRGFSLSGCSTTGEVVMLRLKATPSMPEHYSIVSTSLRWGTTMYFLNDVFRPLNSWVMAGYENWYPFNMSCSVAMYINSGGFGMQGEPVYTQPDLLGSSPFSIMKREDRGILFSPLPASSTPKGAYSLVMSNGYGDVYRMNLMRDRYNYQAYRGICSYRGFSLSGCSTTGEVVMLRIKETPSMPEYFSILSTSRRWGRVTYILNDVFRPLNSWVMAGYENWYPFNMSCSVAMYISSGGFGMQPFRAEPITAKRSTSFVTDNGTGTNLIGALLPLTGDLADTGSSYQSALLQALSAITNTPGMPPIQLLIEDTQTDASIAYNKLVEMRSNGYHIVLGPESSEECRILKTYANENDVLLLSSSSTATPLSLPSDNLMRLTIDDSNQARVLAELLSSDGISDIAILNRSDIYGEGFMTALIQEHNARGGTVFVTNYCPRVTYFIPEIVSNMATQVSNRIAVKGANRVAVVTILFGEGVDVMTSAADHTGLSAVRWYGCDGMAQNNSLLTNVTAAAFAAKTRFVCSTFGRFTNELYSVVESNIVAETGNDVVPRYPMSCYDGFRLVASTLHQTGSTQTMASLIAGIKSVASNYSGCTGPIVFNSADDRANGNYDFYEVDLANGAYTWVNLEGKTPVAPENVTASRGSYSDSIKVSWNPVSGATSYELWGSVSAQSSDATKIATLVSTMYDVTGISADTPCYFWIKTINANGTSVFSSVAEGWASSITGPCIRVNGSKSAVTILSPETASVTIELNPGIYQGTDADWWIVANTPGGWYYRDASGQWQYSASGAFSPAWQGALFNLGATEILNISGLVSGSYTFYFGVDTRDGILDPSSAWYSSIQLTVY
ncbi:ABC transporter substrate-binding protein [Verrucomicrobiota bacterium]